MADIVHELSWSTSRAGTFDTCARRYYHEYYLSWQGWSPSAPRPRRTAYLLKKMTRLPMLAGNAIHEALEEWIQAREQGAQLSEDGVLKAALGKLRRGYRESRDGKWKRSPSKFAHLAEHHYEEQCVDEQSGAAGDYGKRYVERLTAGVNFFFQAPELAAVRDAEPKDFLACEELGSFQYDGTKLYAVPDFAFRRPNGDVLIYDWKSGLPRKDDRFQLSVYALYAEARWGIDPESVTCIDAYLPDGILEEARFTRTELDEVKGRIDTSLAAMRAVHFNADREEGDPEAFAQIPAGTAEARECGFCNYRELCDRA